MTNKYRDPIHGFIEISELENQIINTYAFQRLRNIKQLAMTYLVFHGAEHTRFEHSLGTMFLVTKALRAAIRNEKYEVLAARSQWYEQILRLIALTHDLRHAPFSHASESVFPDGLEHEHFTEKIIKETGIAGIINEIGQQYQAKYGVEYNITAELICDIYMGRGPGVNSEFTFLNSFMDSELDCDKTDYLLRDSLYCGVNYGRYDVDRLISSLTIHMQDGIFPRLAISDGGIQAFEEFVLARYFMFIQVYFHRNRRYFDIMLHKALLNILPNGKYPSLTEEYIRWDDTKVIQLMQEKAASCEACNNRVVYSRIYRSKQHSNDSDKQVFRAATRELYLTFGRENFIEDSAGKMPHKIPIKTEVVDEQAIIIVDDNMEHYTTISKESHIISSLTDKKMIF